MVDWFALYNAALVFLYGYYLTIHFSGGYSNKKERRIINFLCVFFFLIQILCYKELGFDTTRKLYPFITHLPIILTLVFILKKPWGVAIASMLIGYFCCQLPRWVAIIFAELLNPEMGQIAYSLFIFPIYYVLVRYFTSAAYKAMTYSKKALILFGGLPMLYYLFDYFTRIYTNALYEGIRVVSESLPTAMALFYVVFVTIYHKEVQHRNQIELENSILAMEFDQAKNELFSLSKIQEQTAAYRHDMRHHFTVISGYLETDETKKAIQYIQTVKKDIDHITPKQYCENTAINLVLSAFSDKAEKLGVQLSIEANISNSLPIPETALCTLFSNGLENAIHATANFPKEGERIVRLNSQPHKGNLLILIKNPYVGEISFRDQLPINNQPGHGFGVKSIKLIADMYSGFCSFEAQDGIFTLKVVLPFERDKGSI